MTDRTIGSQPDSLSKTPLVTEPSRRSFLKSSAAGTMAAGAALVPCVWSSVPARASKMANQRLDIAVVGVANRGQANLNGVASQNIVTLCDVDSRYLGKAGQKFPKAKKLTDYRKLMDSAKDFDAVVVSTPDHHHFPASFMALQMGKHCYCEKPLTHSVWEARTLSELATKEKLVTQMGSQIHASRNYRNVVELIRSGAIGKVKRVHVWVGKGWGGGDLPDRTDKVPVHLDWKTWLGPAPQRPFLKGRYHAANWRRWWDFGGGTLGDMACHVMDLPFWALDLKHPTQITANGPAVHKETCPLGLQVNYQFPGSSANNVADDGVELVWYDGNRTPKELEGIPVGWMGVMFVGEKGQLVADYSKWKMYPEKDFKDFEVPAHTIPDSVGHHKEWIQACKTGAATTCNFHYSGRLTESVLLGNVAYRSQKTLKWDASNLKVDDDSAQTLIQRRYSTGWRLTDLKSR